MTEKNRNKDVKNELLCEIINEVQEESEKKYSLPDWMNWGNWGNWRKGPRGPRRPRW